MTEEKTLYTKKDFIHLAPDENSWGCSIQFNRENNAKISGHKTPMVEDGQVFGQRMESGKTAVFKIKNVKPCGNPRDMFFAEADLMHYLEI